jgi:ADP-glucose type glycogen/starch synthase
MAIWLGNKAQRELLRMHQGMENKVKAADDEKLLSIWRHLSTADHYYYMSTSADPGISEMRDDFTHYSDATEAIMNYTLLLTEVSSELKERFPRANIHRKRRQPRILLVTPEVTELPPGMGNLANFVSAKGGGLADISAALVAELVRLGLDVHVALPKYERQMRDYARVSQHDLDRMVGVFQNVEAIHLVHDSAFVHLQDVYQEGDAYDAMRRAIAFQRNVIGNVLDAAMPSHGKMLVHCNDWMTGLIPAAARARGFASLFTVHNIHTGRESLRNLERWGIDVSRFWQELYLEKHPDFVDNPWETVGVDFLLSGIKAADHVNTVSPTFLREMVDGYFPNLINNQIRDALCAKYNMGCASGILNAPKSTVDPRVTRELRVNYGASNVMAAKRENKLAFQREMGLLENADAPLFFWPHRLFDQKGPGLLAEISMSLLNVYRDDGLQIAVVGNGDTVWEDAFGTLSCGSGGRIAYAHFKAALSELGKAAADFILMPSLYEPCGLPQMEGMRYGTLPIVRATGGLKDSVQHLNITAETGNGFVFNDFLPDALWWACQEAMRFYRCPVNLRERIIRRVMKEGMEHFNLEKTTLQYVRIYERLLGEKLI